MKFKIKVRAAVDKSANKNKYFLEREKHRLDTHFKYKNSYEHCCQNENNNLDPKKNGLEMADFVKFNFLTRFSLKEKGLNKYFQQCI